MPQIDAATVAQVEQTLLEVLYRFEHKILEQVTERMQELTSEVASELTLRVSAALGEIEDKVDGRLTRMEARLTNIKLAIDAVLMECDIADAADDVVCDVSDDVVCDVSDDDEDEEDDP
jgi:hypothetical protein